MNIVYFITCMEKVETDEKGWIDTGTQRTMGYYMDKEAAIKAVHINSGDIRECLYDYAVVEGIEEGVYGDVVFEQWFKYDQDKDGFFEIDKPKETFNFCNFALG